MKTKAYFPLMHIACSNDDLRPVLHYVLVTKENVVATNAHIMPMARTSDLFDDEFIQKIPEDGMLVHKDDWKKITQCDFAQWESENVIELVHSKKRNELIKVESQKEVGQFPDWKRVLPQDWEKEQFNFFGINAKLLYDVQCIISKNEDICIETFGQKKAFLVKSSNNEAKTVALIMPCVTPDLTHKVNVRYEKGIYTRG